MMFKCKWHNYIPIKHEYELHPKRVKPITFQLVIEKLFELYKTSASLAIKLPSCDKHDANVLQQLKSRCHAVAQLWKYNEGGQL